jgi:hypothetical protein
MRLATVLTPLSDANLAGAIGGGEWIVGPLMAVKYGTTILWVATAAIFLQMVFNLEAVRYTLYSSEPVLTGIMRLSPGPRVWGGRSTWPGCGKTWARTTPGRPTGRAARASSVNRVPSVPLATASRTARASGDPIGSPSGAGGDPL